MAILLLDLPPEVLHIVLFHSALIRHIRRAVRLRLVCKTFNAALPAALFETRLMDDVCGIGTQSWCLQAPYAERMWHEYLVVRTMGETDPAVGRFCEIRRVAQLARQEMVRNDDAPVPALRELVENLCWLLLRQTVPSPDCWTSWGPMGPARAFPPDITLLPLNLLSAAAYLNLPTLAQRLLDEGHNPNHHTFLFAPAMQTAAQAGHGAMLECLQRKGCQNELCALEAGMGGSTYRKRHNWAIVGATIRGDVDFLRRVLAREVPTALPRPLDPMLGPMSLARTRDVYKCLVAAVCPGPGPALAPWNCELEYHARYGHLDMVEYLLDLGLSPEFEEEGRPLVTACVHGHWDVVELLLARGASPNKPFNYANILKYAIHAPAVANSVTVARLLLDHGADPNSDPDNITRDRWPYPAIWNAFQRENMALVRLLVERGAQLDEALRHGIAGMLHHLEYESMEAEFHRLFGFKLEPGTPYPVRRRKGRGWHRWSDAIETRNRILAQSFGVDNPNDILPAPTKWWI